MGAILGPRRPRRTDLRRLGIFGGTFDPIHFGHLICADQLREALGLDLVIFMPCSRSPHKPGYRPAAAGHRLSMARLAVRGVGAFAVSDVETRRGGTSYTIQTIRQLRRQYGQGVELWLLMGMDAYLDVPSWKEPRAILRECSLGVACRPGYRRRERRGLLGGRVCFVETTAVDISSTGIRQRLRAGRGARFLVPNAVERYIRRTGLYGTGRRRTPRK